MMAITNMASLVLDRHVEAGQGDRPALHFGDQSFTYGELQRQVNACGNALLELGVARGDRFLIRSGNRPEYLVAFLAGLKIGAVPIPANSLFRVRELEHILNNSGAKVALTTNDLARPILEVRDRCPSLEQLITFDDEASDGLRPFADLVRDRSTELAAVDTAANDLAFIIYTSGTTGEPKGVEHAHRWIAATGDPICVDLMQLTPDDLCFSPLEVSFIYALGCNFLYPLYSGAAVSMMPGRFDPGSTLAAIAKLRPTVLIAVPTIFRRFFALGDAIERSDLGSLRLGLSSGEPLPEDTLRQARARLGIEILDCLGQTEIHIFMKPDPVRKLGSLGRPLAGHTVTVLTDDGLDAPPGQIGHLVIRADDPGLCLGYRGRPDLWSATQKDGWYYTKDLAYKDKDGDFWYVSRSDDLIKSRAYLISPREIESALLEHPAVLEAGVIGAPDEMIGQRVKAFVILKDGQTPSDDLAAAITRSVADKIASFKVPKELVFVDTLPRTATGKLMRRELRAL